MRLDMDIIKITRVIDTLKQYAEACRRLRYSRVAKLDLFTER